MSMTLIIMDAPEGAAGVEAIGDENPYFLGAFGEVIGLLRQVFPNADFSDPTSIKARGYGEITIEIAKHTPVASFTMHLESPSDLEMVRNICWKANWKVMDTETGRFLEVKAGKTGKVETRPKKWWRFWKK